jgi:hypothetical protein
MAAPPDPGTVFVDYRPRRWLRRPVLIGAAAVLALFGLGYAVRVTVPAGSPGTALAAYFAALADRDLAAALALTAPEATPATREVVNEAVLRSPDYSPPGQVSVSRVSVDGDDATARVTFTIEGRELRVDALRLRRAGGAADAIRPRWLVIDAFGTLQLGAAVERVTVNGRLVTAYDAQGARFLDALPGGYQVGVPEDDPLWESRPVLARVEPQDTTEVDVALVPRPAVREEVDRQLVRLLDGCAASTELEPPGCPFGYRIAGSAVDVRWQILSYPRVGLAAGPAAGQPQAVVETAREGTAMVTGTRRFVGRFQETVPVRVSGTVVVSGDTVVFRPDW